MNRLSSVFLKGCLRLTCQFHPRPHVRELIDRAEKLNADFIEIRTFERISGKTGPASVGFRVVSPKEQITIPLAQSLDGGWRSIGHDKTQITKDTFITTREFWFKKDGDPEVKARITISDSFHLESNGSVVRSVTVEASDSFYALMEHLYGASWNGRAVYKNGTITMAFDRVDSQ